MYPGNGVILYPKAHFFENDPKPAIFVAPYLDLDTLISILSTHVNL